MTTTTEGLLRVNDVRKLLGNMGRNQLYVLIHSGEIESFTIGKNRYFEPDAVQKLIERRKAAQERNHGAQEGQE